jgi:hypothetical protein
MNATSNSVAVVDGFDVDDPSTSPIRGPEVRLKDGSYYAFQDKLDVAGRAYAALDKVRGWQKLEEGCPPEYLMQRPGDPRPPQPSVPEADWPLNLNGVPEHPWKWTHYLYLLDTETGEISTFSSNTKGGNIAIGNLNDQVSFMRRAQPDAIPVIALESREMPTKYGTKLRPHFKLLGWRTRGGTESGGLLLTGPEQKAPVEATRRVESSAAAKPVEPEAPTTRAEGMSKLKAQVRDGTPRRQGPTVKEPTLREELNDEIPEATQGEAPWEDRSPERAKARLETFRARRRS